MELSSKPKDSTTKLGKGYMCVGNMFEVKQCLLQIIYCIVTISLSTLLHRRMDSHIERCHQGAL